MFLRNYLNRIPSKVSSFVRYAGTNPIDCSYTPLYHNPKLSKEEEERVLSALNQLSGEELRSLSVSQGRAKKLELYRTRKGPFKSLSDILDIDGFGVKIVDKLCENIISEEPPKQVKKMINGKNRRLRHFLVPTLLWDETNFQVISSIVGIHLTPTGASWAKLDNIHSHLLEWNFRDLASLPKKVLPHDNFNLARDILKQIPVGDVYILEGHSNMGLQGQKQPATITSYTQNLELISMLLSLLNTSATHNASDPIRNKVYFLRSKLHARLFKTLVGNECVSSHDTVMELLDNPNPDEFSLPCSPIIANPKLKSDYLKSGAAHKDLLGQALMLSVAFTELCLRQNEVSLQALGIGKK